MGAINTRQESQSRLRSRSARSPAQVRSRRASSSALHRHCPAACRPRQAEAGPAIVRRRFQAGAEDLLGPLGLAGEQQDRAERLPDRIVPEGRLHVGKRPLDRGRRLELARSRRRGRPAPARCGPARCGARAGARPGRARRRPSAPRNPPLRPAARSRRLRPAAGADVALRRMRDAARVVPHRLHVGESVAWRRQREHRLRLAELRMGEERRRLDRLHPGGMARGRPRPRSSAPSFSAASIAVGPSPAICAETSRKWMLCG